jgi:hypothetical protein
MLHSILTGRWFHVYASDSNQEVIGEGSKQGKHIYLSGSRKKEEQHERSNNSQ